MFALVYCGFGRETEVLVDVEPVTWGVGRIDCLECGGSGEWPFMEPEIPTHPCVTCKGTGKVLVSL